MKKILICGGSFVHENGSFTYADHIKADFSDVTVIGVPGAGNDLTSNIVLSNFLEYETIIIDWTPTSRYDIQISDQNLIKLFEDIDIKKSFIDNNYWLMSGGSGSQHTQPGFNKIWHVLWKYHFQIEDSWRRTLQQILCTQQLLTNYNKNHLSLFSNDTFENQSFGDYEKEFQHTRSYDKSKWLKFLKNNKWTDLVDWPAIWFHKNQYTSTGGILDWCHDNTEDIGHHPSNNGHKQFYQSVLKPWIEAYN